MTTSASAVHSVEQLFQDSIFCFPLMLHIQIDEASIIVCAHFSPNDLFGVFDRFAVRQICEVLSGNFPSA